MSNNKGMYITDSPVKYPQSEKAYAFVNVNGIPFNSAVVGITLPAADYSIKRSRNTSIALFEYVISGSGEVFCNGVKRTVRSGDFYILPPYTEHVYSSSKNDPLKKIWINYKADYMVSFLDAYGIKGGVYRSDTVKEYFDEIFELTKDIENSKDQAYKIADNIHKIVREASVVSGGSSDKGSVLRELVSSQVYKKPSMEEISAEVHMSRSGFIRAFKKYYSVTPYDYLLDLKAEHAKMLLSSTDLPIKEIAYKLCLGDEHNFSAFFKKRTGMRPGEYRKKLCINK